MMHILSSVLKGRPERGTCKQLSHARVCTARVCQVRVSYVSLLRNPRGTS